MNNAISTERTEVEAQLVAKIYRLLIGHPAFNYTISGTMFPTFDQLFEEYITVLIERETKMTSGQISEELRALKTKGLMEYLEKQFPEEYDASKKIKLMQTLNYLRLTFQYKGEVMNPPIRGVW